MTWVLLLFFHAGMLSQTDSQSATTVTGFASKEQCELAGKQSEKTVSMTKKSLRWTCLKVGE